MKSRVGEVYFNTEGYRMEIIEYSNNRNCTIKFEEGTIIKDREFKSIREGEIKNPIHPSVYGVGYIGVGKYTKSYGGLYNKMYYTWYNLLKRCFCEEYQEKYPTYKECSVTEDWYNFQNFAEWFEQNYIEGFQLDKDLLVKGNKIYSPETCCFIPQEINKLLTKCDSKRGRYPIGVSLFRKSYLVKLSVSGKSIYLGSFNTPEEAFEAYKVGKEIEIRRVAGEYKVQITEPCYQALINYKIEIND